MKYLFDTDHISFLQRRSGSEYANLVARIATSSPADFTFSVVSLHEQVLGANTFINRAQTSAGTIRGYTAVFNCIDHIDQKRKPRPYGYIVVYPTDIRSNTLLEILQGFSPLLGYIVHILAS